MMGNNFWAGRCHLYRNFKHDLFGLRLVSCDLFRTCRFRVNDLVLLFIHLGSPMFRESSVLCAALARLWRFHLLLMFRRIRLAL